MTRWSLPGRPEQVVAAHHPGSGTASAPAIPSRQLLVEPEHVAVGQPVLPLVRVIPFLGGEEVALDAPEAKSRFLIKGDLADAGIASADYCPAESARTQISQHPG